MSWRTVVVSSNAKLDYQIGYMVVRGEKTTKIHLNEIGMLIVESTAVSMTSYLLSELMKRLNGQKMTRTIYGQKLFPRKLNNRH